MELKKLEELGHKVNSIFQMKYQVTRSRVEISSKKITPTMR